MKNNRNSSMADSGMLKIAKKAIGNALLHHKAIGNEIVFWKDGKMVREKLTVETSLPKLSNAQPDISHGQ